MCYRKKGAYSIIERRIPVIERKERIIERKMRVIERKVGVIERKVRVVERKVCVIERKVFVIERNVHVMEREGRVKERKVRNIERKVYVILSSFRNTLPLKMVFVRLFLSKSINLPPNRLVLGVGNVKNLIYITVYPHTAEEKCFLLLHKIYCL